ncbi:MAG: hypothetical protein JJ969_15740 [Rhizobiaceae bacterium]|nr:hypothetical protein [Rhizobiaceae bacterium]
MNLILSRRREVEQEIARTRDLLAELDKELAELDMAGRVVARLTGAKWPEAGSANQPAAQTPSKSKKSYTLPDMISFTLRQSYRTGRRGLTPKEIRDSIKDNLDPNVRSEAVSSICWRMWKRGQLIKDDDSAEYRLPEKDMATDLLSVRDQSAAIGPEAQGG